MSENCLTTRHFSNRASMEGKAIDRVHLSQLLLTTTTTRV